MHQTWDKLLFVHSPVRAAELRRHVPAGLELDEFNGQAWVSVAPFTMHNIRAAGLPAIPGLSASHELNVRTYVSARSGEPGVWFFSLDASNPVAVWGARKLYHLPYFHARMDLRETTEGIRFTSRREGVAEHREAPPELQASWSIGTPLPLSERGSLQFFLTERYWLYSSSNDRLYRARIEHEPWPLAEARVASYWSTMLSAQGLPGEGAATLCQAQRAPLAVDIWPLETVP